MASVNDADGAAAGARGLTIYAMPCEECQECLAANLEGRASYNCSRPRMMYSVADVDQQLRAHAEEVGTTIDGHYYTYRTLNEENTRLLVNAVAERDRLAEEVARLTAEKVQSTGEEVDGE